MQPDQPTPSSDVRRRLPELPQRNVVYLLLILGIAGMLAEIVSTPFIPRVVLYLLVLSMGIAGLVRRRGADLPATPAVLHDSHRGRA